METIMTSDGFEECNLSDEVYIIKVHNYIHQATDYQYGCEVRLISGIDGNDSIGYHRSYGWVTVCAVGSDHAQFIGFQSCQLELKKEDV